MALLDLPQELLDLIGAKLNAIDLIAVRATSWRLYCSFGGNDILRHNLTALEKYWASKTHIMSISRGEDIIHKSDLYPSYRHYFRRAPCYTCLRISTPENTARERLNVAMLPWVGFSRHDRSLLDTVNYFERQCRSLFDTVNLERQCIGCAIHTAKRTGKPQRRHYPCTSRESVKFLCRGCYDVQHFQPRDFMFEPERFKRSMQCEPCFDSANVGWLSFRLRLYCRVARIQRYYEHLRLCQDPTIRYQGRNGIGPLPPEDDIREDAALWLPILQEPCNFHEASRMETLLRAMGPMGKYLSWMGKLDARKICRHQPLSPPNMDSIADLGPWPDWQELLQNVSETVDEWITTSCVYNHRGLTRTW